MFISIHILEHLRESLLLLMVNVFEETRYSYNIDVNQFILLTKKGGLTRCLLFHITN